MIRRPPRSTLFPYTRSSDLIEIELSQLRFDLDALDAVIVVDVLNLMGQHADRKSTRLNSSHSQISYAVFCLKKKMTSKARSQLHNQVVHISQLTVIECSCLR